jgi:hypothetical protein
MKIEEGADLRGMGASGVGDNILLSLLSSPHTLGYNGIFGAIPPRDSTQDSHDGEMDRNELRQIFIPLWRNSRRPRW